MSCLSPIPTTNLNNTTDNAAAGAEAVQNFSPLKNIMVMLRPPTHQLVCVSTTNFPSYITLLHQPAGLDRGLHHPIFEYLPQNHLVNLCTKDNCILPSEAYCFFLFLSYITRPLSTFFACNPLIATSFKTILWCKLKPNVSSDTLRLAAYIQREMKPSSLLILHFSRQGKLTAGTQKLQKQIKYMLV